MRDNAPVATAWSRVQDGLQIGLDPPQERPRAGTTLTVTLRFRNCLPTPLRVWLLHGEVYRAFQSVLRLQASDGQLLAVGPEPVVARYLVTEADLLFLPPGAEQTTTQGLWLRRNIVVGDGDLTLWWTYTNTSAEWAGMVRTPSELTKDLVVGAPIPYIWMGRLEVNVPVRGE